VPTAGHLARVGGIAAFEPEPGSDANRDIRHSWAGRTRGHLSARRRRFDRGPRLGTVITPTDRPAAALALRTRLTYAPALDVLDVVSMDGPVPPMLLPPELFALLVAEAFDLGMHRDDWAVLMRPKSDPRVHAALLSISRN
jgi:hypothetical protein